MIITFTIEIEVEDGIPRDAEMNQLLEGMEEVAGKAGYSIYDQRWTSED